MKKRFAAIMMSVIMLVTMLPMSVASASPVVPKAYENTIILHNDNQGDGAVLVKFAQPHLDENGMPDGTVDIVIQAHTTGQVHKSDIVVPTDIVLVLDLSGSMDTVEGQVTREIYVETDATQTNYGFSSYYTLGTTNNVYRKNGDGSYTRVTNSSYDRNGYQYFRSGSTYVYPELADGVIPSKERQYDYTVEQLYVLTTEVVDDGSPRIDLLKAAVDSFISSTAEYNETLNGDTSKMHRIALVKFATADYYNDNNLTAEGDNKNSSGYNYSQVVKNFTTVYGDGETELVNAMNALESGGATAIDYGMNLANALFEAAEGTEAAEGRKKVVVVVSDGSPTHNNSYSSSVAGAAINHANTLKNENVTIYTIGVAEGSDGTQLGSDNTNRFMHYLSSNYPSASYENGNITAGTGSPDSGYYLTPDNANNLSMIFERISTEIGEPAVELGEEALLVDTVSEFFTIPAGANRVTVATADKTATGWKDAVESDLVPAFSNDRTVVTVKGFNFDENYVSAEPREVDGKEFYGRMLILAINVTPNTATIDTHTDEIAANGGLVPTNDGTAEIMSGTNVVAAVESPEIQLNKIAYTVDGQPYAAYYRLAGMSYNIIAEPTRKGYTFSGWTLADTNITVDNGAFTMPANDVEIEGSFTAVANDVTYKFVGLEVYDNDDLPDALTDVTYGTTVTVADKPEIAGYTFIGWYPQDNALSTGNIESFSMPEHDVVLLGRFVPDTDTAYTVEHYTENLDGTFKLEDTENLSGTTGETAVAAPKSYVGFTYDEDYDDGTYKTVASGTIDANGELVLKLYYVRNEWTLTYEYVGTVPGGAEPAENALGAYTATFKYGETVDIEEDASASGYTFTGWYSLGGTVQPTTESFEMPNHDVTLHGYFTARTDIGYTVEHYFENTDGDFVLDDTKTETFANATMGTTVSAPPLNIQYYTFDSDNVENIPSGEVKGDGSLVLKLYYERTSYTVTYDYEGAVPAAVTPERSALASLGGTYKWGEEVDLTDVVPGAADHIFHGWYYIGDNGRTGMPATFEMPKANVLILGHFDPTTGLKYYVEHYFINDEGEYIHNADYDEEFTGNAGQNVTATPVDVEGYAYNDEYSEQTASGTVPLGENGTLTLKLYYDYAKYTVKYFYEGLVPTGASELPDDAECGYNSTVTVEPDASAPGYDFKGWYRNNDANKTEITSFTMPAYNVELAGRFAARSDTPYTVEHYLETAVDGVYEVTPFATENLIGTTGTEVSATPKGVEYYTYNPNAAGAKRTGIVTADNPATAENEALVLKLYYDRNTYSVKYVYTTAPAEAVLPTDTNKYTHGTAVTTKSATDVEGYAFSGWSANGITVNGGAILGGGEFTMPTANVIFVGSYIAKAATYTVEHWIQNPENPSEYVLYGTPEVRQGLTDQSVTAISHVLHGYTYSPDVTEQKIPNGSDITFADADRTVLKGIVDYDGTLTLSFYYTVDEYDVVYIIEGAAPDGADTPNAESYKFGQAVTVHEGYDIPGYEFSGWDTDDATVDGDEFSMPANDVTFRGSFTPVATKYTIKYWQQVLEGTGTAEHNGKYYDEVVNDRVEGLSAITGHYVSAYPNYIKTYEGFVATPENNNEYYGHVLGDGSLVLNLYYDRLTYSVTYVYSGTAPEGVAVPDSYNKESVMYGATVDVEPKLDAYDGFEFNGWHSNSVSVANGETEFTMPAKNVVLYGRHDAEYTVTYYVDGNHYEEHTVIPGEVHDIIGRPDGTGNFSGWSDPFNVKEGRSFDADEGDFIMPWSDVELAGKFNVVIPIIPRGTMVITKEVNAPDNFTGSDEYTFEIYRIRESGEELVETVTVKAGESLRLTTAPGEYKVAEVNAEVDGFTLNTAISAKNGIITVNNSETAEITFTNTYAPVMLEKDDHFGYIIGYPDGTVRPEANITRAEVVTIFFRMFTDSARDYYWKETNKFTDVADTDWYNLAISTLANAGVLDGYTDGTFRPNETITRAELIKIASSFYDTAAGKESEFSDIAAHWAEKFIEEAYKLGIVEGYGDGTFHPDEPVTRAEAMKIVNRTLERAPHKDGLLADMIKWPDNADTEKWYYADVQEATNSHEYDFSGEYEIWTSLRPMRDWAALELGWREEHKGK